MHRYTCAVVVTFHPHREVLRNLALIRAQVWAMVVVDNGSDEESLRSLRDAGNRLQFRLIENGSNLGIATALNRGVKHATELGYAWVVLFDQDSVVTESFMDAMFARVEQHPALDEVAVFCPRYLDYASGQALRRIPARGGGLAECRTSGSLMPAWVFRECGYFNEEMFIDQVDYEYCMRVRERDYLIVECPGATLLHTLGAPRIYRLWGRRVFGSTNHSAARRYYLVRNRTWLFRKYWRRYPAWCLDAGVATLKESAKILIAEPGRWLKIGLTFRGIRDGALGRMGKRVEL